MPVHLGAFSVSDASTMDRPGRFFAPIPLGRSRTRAHTPEGYLVIHDVPVARTGIQLYKAGEVGLDGDGDGKVIIDREPDEVFRPETMASANGKDIVIDHPADGELITPDSWKKHSIGHMQNPRRGEGIEDDLMFVDFVIKDPDAIKSIEDGKLSEISCGYDCEYEQTATGRGRQHNIMINHAAFVDAGRCGSRCAIGDEMPVFDVPRRKRQVHVHMYVKSAALKQILCAAR